MTLKTQIASDASVFLDTDEFADSLTHYPLGVVASAATVTAVFIPAEPELHHERGKGIIIRGELHVASSLSVNDKDVWLINSSKYKTERIGDAEQGLRIIHVVRRDAHFTTSDRRTRSGR